MARAWITACTALAIWLSTLSYATAQPCPTLSQNSKTALLDEHLFGGPPSNGNVLVRRGYVSEYDAVRRVPRWVAWHATKSYLDTPERIGRWKSFHPDPDISDPVVHDDYRGLFASFNFARGHLAPYFISGGDRDGDGIDAEIESDDRLPIEDIDDACTVFEINYMSNVAPQLHYAFNGAGGLWFELETIVREDLLETGKDLHIIAGTVFGNAPVQKVGPTADIQVPHMFYKILIGEPGVVAFLFVHSQQIGETGCPLDAGLEECIVAIGDIETLTDLDFLADLDDTTEAKLEGTDGRAVFQALLEK